MSKNFCIPKEMVPQLKARIAKLADGNQIEALTKMDSEKRVAFFEDVLRNSEEATTLNKRFEDAISKKKLDALRNWVKENLDASYRQDEAIFNTKSYKNLAEVDNFIESRMELLAEQKLGVALTDEQMKTMIDLGNDFFNESKKLGDNLGKLDAEEQNIAWGKAYKALADKRDSLMPTSWWKAIVNNLGRANMLASIKTPFLNIESNIIGGITEAVARRGSIGTINKNPVVRDLSKDYQKFARKMFRETGIDFTRMIDIDDTVTGIGKIVGEETTRIPNATARAYTDFIFNKTLSTPDVFFAAKAFTDSLALRVTKLAGKDDKLAKQLFIDATNINATGEAKIMRDLAIADARFATYTNDSLSSDISLKLRETLNKAGGIGDILMPFVKTVGNVAEANLEYAGFGFVKGSFVVGKSLMKDGVISKEAMRTAMRSVARSGLGMTAGYLLAQNFDPEHFIGVYDPKRQTIDQLANTTNNAILIGDRWVSVDYLGPLASPFVSFMYAKKYGGGSYVTGATSAYLAQIPFSKAITSVSDKLSELNDPANTASITEIAKDLAGETGDTIASRLVPGISYDLARAFDDVQRDTKQSKFVLDTPFYDFKFDTFVNKIPFLRLDLPVKHDVLGRVMLEATPIESMLFGARVRNANMDATTSEILRLRQEGYTLNVKDLRFMRSTNVDKLKAKLGPDEFVEVVIKYGEDVAKKYEKELNSSGYERAIDEEKVKRLDRISEDMYKQLLKRHNIK